LKPLNKVFLLQQYLRFLLSSIAILFFIHPAAAQSGGWYMLFNQTRLNQKFSIHAEAQFRSFELLPNTEQLLLRTGLNYHINSDVMLSCGYGYIENFADEAGISKKELSYENRIWQQALLKNKQGRFYFEHRYRLEQRWLKVNLNDFKNRARYLLRITVPINNKEIIKNTLFFSCYDEVFLHLNKNPFDRNRLFGAVGFQFAKNANMQFGYLFQSLSSKTKNYFQFAINYNLDFRKQ
jgi:hypothetical protein